MVKILMPVDGSDHDTRTATFLGSLLKGTQDAEVLVLHVAHRGFPTTPAVEVGFVPVIPPPEALERWEQGIREDAEAIVARGEQAVRDAGLRATKRVAWGSAAEVIEQIAEEQGIDLIVMGSRGAGHRLVGIFVGSVSDRVLHRAKVPVLIVR